MANQVVLDVQGMTCDSCERHVASALSGAGAQDVQADWRAGEARFSLPDGVAEDALRDAVTASGYTPRELHMVTGAEPSGAGPAPTAEDADYDLVVIGAGSAAFAAAITAADAGRTVALVEAATIGGTCVNVGCVPSKALLRAGELRGQVAANPFAGIDVTANGVDLAALVAQKDELVDALRQAKYVDLVDDYGFDVLHGFARFVDPDTIDVDGRRVRARAFLVATGASAWAPPIPGLEDAGHLTSTTALELKEVPARLAVIGANAIGLELGQFFAHVGSQVTFLDVAERIAPFEEPEVSDAMTQYLVDEGATVHAGAAITRVESDGDLRRIVAEVDGAEVVVEVDEILVATGRRANTDGLGLDAAGVEVDGRGAIVVDGSLGTSNPRVWAAGDVVAGSPQFVYVSAHHGALAADNALAGAGREVDYTGLPRVTFTAPQIASAGLTEAQAREQGHDVKTSLLPLEHVPRALVNRDTRGLVKLVADRGTDRLLGASVLADAGGEVIQTAVIAIRQGMTTAELAATFHPYLTMVEGLKLAAQTFDRDVAKLSCCAA
ncbi:MAG: mercury(II) reductase [Nitriliruptorales bacterium]